MCSGWCASATGTCVLMDMSMPGRSGIDLIKQVKSEKPKLPILVLSMHQEHQYAVRAMRAGASGYLNKDSASELLVSAIRKVVGGGVFVSEAAAELLAREYDARRGRPAAYAALGSRVPGVQHDRAGQDGHRHRRRAVA